MDNDVADYVWVYRTVAFNNNLFTGALPAFARTVVATYDSNCWTTCSAYYSRPSQCAACIGPPTDPLQTAALLSLYTAAGGPMWTNRTGWSTAGSDPCTPSTWFGTQACPPWPEAADGFAPSTYELVSFVA